MFKTKKKPQKITEHTVIHPVAERVGAVVLSVLGFLVSFELMLEHHPKLSHAGSHANSHGISEVFARGETKGETARLPEEFDTGLQTPHITGL